MVSIQLNLGKPNGQYQLNLGKLNGQYQLNHGKLNGQYQLNLGKLTGQYQLNHGILNGQYQLNHGKLNGHYQLNLGKLNGQYQLNLGKPNGQYQLNLGKPNGQYQLNLGKPNGQYQLNHGKPNGQYQLNHGKLNGQYQLNHGILNGQYQLNHGKPNGHYQLNLGKLNGQYQLNLGKPNGQYQLNLGKPNGQYQLNLGKPNGQYQLNLGKPNGQYQLNLGKPNGQYQLNLGKPNGQYQLNLGKIFIIASEPVNISMKLRVYISQLWNLLDTIGIALFSIGVVLRFIPATLRDAQLIYSVDVIFWNIRMLEIFSVNKYLGPYVKIMGKLLRDMCYFLTILFIAVTSFGVVRQTVHFQNQEVSWRLRLRNVWYYPYWMIYGELFAEEIDPCLDENATDYKEHCNIYASWLAPAFMCIFLLVANILMVNLLIARFNATFIRNNANSKEIWMFQRYGLILQYEMRPILPPPFIIITHIYLAFKYIKRRCKGKRDFYDNGLKLFLSHEDTEKLHDFEEECMEDLYREKELKHQNSSEERIKFISERVENMSLRLDDMNVKENHLRLSLSALDHRMNRIDDLENSLDEAIRIIKLLSSREEHGSQNSLDDQNSHLQPPQYSSSSSIDGSSHHPRSYSLGSSDLGDRTVPSPMLVHSKKKTLADQLKKFTSNVRRRQLSGSDFPLEESDQFVNESTEPVDKEILAANRNNVRFLIGLADDNDSVENKKQELVNLNPTEQEEPSSHKQKMKNFASQAVRFVEPVVHAASNQNERFQTLLKQPSIDVTSKMDSDTYTTTQLPDYNNIVSQGSGNYNPSGNELPLSAETPVLPVTTPSSTSNPFSSQLSRKGRNSLTNQPLTLNTALASSNFVPCSMPQSSACFTTANPEALPPAAVRDLTTMFTPLIGEYTSITDNIDTSCLMDCSPPCSPASNSTIFADGYHEMDAKLKERSAASSKQLELKQAEEMEHQKMESIIRHRLRQISQDESGSISDIAKVVVAELAAESVKEAALEEESEEVSVLAEEEAAELEERFGAMEKRKSSFGMEQQMKTTTGKDEPSLMGEKMKQLSDIEDEVTTETLFLFRDRVRIQISQPSQDTGDTQSVSKFPC
ncbi:hypothetical protein Btru_034514 [Bulinus truncatus]|nr:hypothetical protein Btru_034514 [Bulinus truncatus]